MKMFHPLLVAVQFLTRVPVPLRSLPGDDSIARSLLYYPVVGLMLGLFIAGLHAWLGDATVAARAALVLAVWVALTGALHLDGLADSADAWAGGRGDRARTAALLKDPHCGPVGAVALILVLLLKFAALQDLPPDRVLLLAFVPALARGMIPLLFATTPYVRRQGLGSGLARTRPTAAVAAACVAIPGGAALVIAGATALWLLLAAAGVLALLRQSMMARIGGTTGDTAGALIESTEAILLAVLAFI